MKLIFTMVIGFFALTLNAQAEEEETLIFSRIGELSDEQLNNSIASKLTFVTDEKEAEKMAELDIKRNSISFINGQNCTNYNCN